MLLCFCRREVEEIDGSGPRVSPSLFISFLLPHGKGTAMCQTPGDGVEQPSSVLDVLSHGEDRPINIQN